MIYLVRISRELLTHGLTLGYAIEHPLEVIEGLPPGCELIAANIELNGILVLSFLKKDDEENEHKIFEQLIRVQTTDSRENKR